MKRIVNVTKLYQKHVYLQSYLKEIQCGKVYVRRFSGFQRELNDGCGHSSNTLHLSLKIEDCQVFATAARKL